MFFWDSTLLLLIPPLILSIWAQRKVQTTYQEFSQVGSRSGLTGAQVAARILRDENIDVAADPSGHPAGSAVGLESIHGHLTDHYDPRDRTLRLSQEVYGGQSVAALGIAAHEVGHAIQHARSYSPLMMRNVMYPACSFSSTLAWPLFIGGFLFSFKPLLTIGILMFVLAVVFTLITLPVEFNASSRAVRALASGGYLSEEELKGTKKVLNAAALTYVAAAAVAVVNLIRMLIIARD